jgi:hypothetical protein
LEHAPDRASPLATPGGAALLDLAHGRDRGGDRFLWCSRCRARGLVPSLSDVGAPAMKLTIDGWTPGGERVSETVVVEPVGTTTTGAQFASVAAPPVLPAVAADPSALERRVRDLEEILREFADDDHDQFFGKGRRAEHDPECRICRARVLLGMPTGQR